MASAMPTQVIISNTLDHATGRIRIIDIKTLATIKEYNINAGNGPVMQVYGDKLSISNGVLNPGEYILNLQDSSVEYYPERRGTVFFTEDSYMYFSEKTNAGEIVFVKNDQIITALKRTDASFRPPNVYQYLSGYVSFYFSNGDLYLVNGNDLSFSKFSLKGYADVIYLNEDKGLAVHGRTLYCLRLSDGQVLKTKKLSFSGNFYFVSKSDDGRFITLRTFSMSLVPWSDTFMHERIDLYVFDLQNETLEKLASSVAGNGVGLTVR